MVASANGDLYTPFPHMPIIEEGVQSSEEGSVLHSPIYEASYATPGGTCTLSGRSSLLVHMLVWRKKAGITITSVTSTATRPLASCYRLRRPLTLAIPRRPWTRRPEIPISWRHYKSRARRPFTITSRLIIIRLPTSLCMDTRCSIWVARRLVFSQLS